MKKADRPLRGSLDGPSRTIIVEPMKQPLPKREIEQDPAPERERAKPERTPAPPAKPAR